LVVHELRYRIAFGDDAESALATSGHGYLGVVAPAVAVLAMLGSRCARSSHRLRPTRRPARAAAEYG